MPKGETEQPTGKAPFAPEPQEGPASVDVTLIDEMLRLTPKQRLEQNDRMAALAVRLRAAFEAGRG